MTPQRARLYRTILVVTTLLLLAVVLWQGRGSLTPFLIGSILAYLLLPLVRLLERLWPERGRWGRARRPLAILVVYLLTIVAVLAAINLVVPPLLRQLGDLADAGPALIDEARERGEAWLVQYQTIVPPEIQTAIEANLAQAGTRVASAIQAGLASSLGWLLRTVNVVLGLLVLPLWLFYVLKDEREGVRFFYNLFPPPVAADVRAIVSIINRVVGRYIRGQLLLGLTVGTASVIALSLIGIPYALLLGLVNGIFELIPIIGPWLGAVPAIIVTLAVAPDKIGIVILFYILLQQVENILLVPKIQGDAVEINPAILIMALVIAGDVAGVWGLLLAVPLTAVVREVVSYLYHRFSPPAAAEPELGP